MLVRTMGAGPSKVASGAARGVLGGGPSENPIFDSMVKKFGIECMKYVEKWQKKIS